MSMTKLKRDPEIHFDTIIIGSGIAGLNFALNAAKQGRVLIITKKKSIESSTNRAQGGIAAVLNKADRFEKHVQDTMEAGSFHNKRNAVEFMVKNSPEAICRLIELGVPFATNVQGKLLLTREGGHSERRIAFVGDYTGAAIEKTLLKKVAQNPKITLWEHTFAIDLLTIKKICYGVQIVRKKNVQNIFGNRIVLATGGLGQIFYYTTNPSISTGDGIAMAMRADLKCRDLEFLQFHPTALKIGGRTKFLLSEALRGEGAILLDRKGQRFMKKYNPKMDLAPRDIVARCVYQEDLNGGAFLDIRHKPSHEIELRFPSIYQRLLRYKLNLTKNLIPIAPAAHYSCGGVMTNLHGETKIKYLYAFGEVAWTGVHGANRLASNSLLEALVFSNQILRSPAREKMDQIPHFVKPALQPNSPKLVKKLKSIKYRIRKIMWEKVGVIRTTKGLKEAKQKLDILEAKLPHFPGLNILLKETENMLLTAKAVTQAALKRKKSLGGHYLLSPEKTKKTLKH
ncbi:MAG: L-aspartate oxidase, L-aspartate oxidase [Candidatus Peregrinibacteria bacterium GW2011_GWE2_39_6]|nr:MAG: L-aspartate oxidase, L-aspartate oxidase [Candidatus Peregrinibacteria bacterium GW2011_GWF2_39_17]KKR25499.1 MAG: L-aspartate oxidase, L-aspartate oxidase [Candidatus Peregrinibacteria bacterium GW2011_GWE2_39_6]HCW31908.1 L-aspartate oxidase [Candidatus Peregrinibacteria bacterium]